MISSRFSPIEGERRRYSENGLKNPIWSFEYLVMSLGLTRALVVVMDLMNIMFRRHLHIFVIMFIYDILIYSKSEDDHISYLRVVLQILKDEQLFSKCRKYEFFLAILFQLRV